MNYTQEQNDLIYAFLDYIYLTHNYYSTMLDAELTPALLHIYMVMISCLKYSP
jgi:hypothetical protein